MAEKKSPEKQKSGKAGVKSAKRAGAKQPPTGKAAKKQPKEAGKGRTDKEPKDQKDHSSSSDAPAAPASPECVVVGIGASAGGLDAYKKLLRNLPDETGLAYVLVQHLDPTHESLMTELLSKYTRMPVLQIADGMPVQPNHIYMIPPNRFVKIHAGGLFLEEPVTKRGVRLPIDHFFSSLAKAREERAICVVLTGTGSDGAAGVRELKAAGGLTIVQKPETAEYDGMPRAAISTGSTDFILPIEDMADVIVPYARHPYVQTSNVTLAESAPDHFRAIISLLRAHTDQDFSRYKQGTLTRRIDRRMSIRQISKPADYLKLLREDNDEIHALFKDLLIGVTRFFRDNNAWDDLTEVLTPLVLEKREEEPFRVWVPGCATGEEAYTVAMLLFAQQQRQNKRLDLQVFATDIDRDAIDTARQGLYPQNITKDLPDSYLDAYFSNEGEHLRVRKKLRETCIFAVQNLLSDPPFSNLDLICCRNLLIYLESDVQRKVFDMLHFALKPGGLLLLGSSESPSKRKELFDVVSQSARIYRKVGDSRPGAGNIALPAGQRKVVTEPEEADQPSQEQIGTVELSKRALLDQFAPASVVVNGRGLIQYMHGPIRNYLDFPTGEPDLNISTMALSGLKTKVRTALHQSMSESKTVSVLAPRVQRNGGHVGVRVRAYPLPSSKQGERLYLISFLDEGENEARPQISKPPSDNSKVDRADTAEMPEAATSAENLNLVQELQATREDLQSTIEELESANEELKASNEEVMSMNEELQSTNEELETSREELQSLNEELSTVNNQLHDKVEELESTNNDLNNLLTSTEMATLFLDDELCIRRFTPATARLMNVLPTDVGRPISDLSGRVNDPGLVEHARQVLDRLSPIATEVQNGGGHWYMRRIMPFRTSDNKIEGVVVTFSDITTVKQGAQRLENRERQQAIVAQLGRSALGGQDLETVFAGATRSVAENLGADLSKVLQLTADKKRLKLVAGVGWDKGLVGKAELPAGTSSQAGFTLQAAGPVLVEDLTTEKRFSGPPILTHHGVISGISVVIGPESAPWGVLGVHSRQRREYTLDDANFVMAISNMLWQAIRRQAVEAKLRDSEARMASFLNNSSVIAWIKDAEGKYVYLSENTRRFLNLKKKEWRGKTDFDLWPQDIADALVMNDQAVLNSQKIVEADEMALDSKGRKVYFLNQKFPIVDSQGQQFVGGLGVNITDRVRAERALAASEKRLRAASKLARFGTYYADLAEKSLVWSPEFKQIVGMREDEPEPDEIGGVPPFVHPDDRDRVAEKIQESLDPAGDGRFEDEHRIVLPDGSQRWVLMKGRTEFSGTGSQRRPVRLGGTMLDNSEQHRAKAAIEEARRKAEAANEAKSVFLATISHEIRTPMTAILGYADVLNSKVDDKALRGYIKTIKENGHYLRDILNDVLDLSRVESGKMPVKVHDFSLVELLADVRSMMAVRADGKGLELTVDFDGRIPETIATDPRLFRQLLVNLVGNAIKFTEKGSVRIVANCSAGSDECTVSVIDTGIGISEARLETIFQPFEQLDTSYTRERGGSGLGLAISNRLAKLLGGTITVDSKPGQGSKFRVTVSAGPLEDAKWISPDPDLLRDVTAEASSTEVSIAGRILAVDDRAEIRVLVRDFLELAGAEVETVENGQEALDALRKSREDSKPYDAVLMDVHMPVMDGFQATAEFRAEGYTGAIIALTAHVLQSDRDQYASSGFDDWLIKPIDRLELLKCLNKCLLQSASKNEAADEATAVLLVDDSKDTCYAQRTLLEQRGYVVETAFSGHEALDIVKRFTPDIAFVDLMLGGGLSGGDVVKQFKTMPKLRNCAFVCVSGHEEAEVDWQELGFRSYLHKPIGIEDLENAINDAQAS